MTNNTEIYLSTTSQGNVKDRNRYIDRAEQFYKEFMGDDYKSSISSSAYYKNDLVKLWERTSTLLRIMFENEMKKKCSKCTHCCCLSCEGSGGYFSTFDLFMYKLRGIEYPDFKNYSTKKGCSAEKTKRSFVCLFYSCEHPAIFELIKTLWYHIIDELNIVVNKKNGNLTKPLSLLKNALDTLEDKYNPEIKIDKSLMLKEHYDNFCKLRGENVFTETINSSIDFVCKLLAKEMAKK